MRIIEHFFEILAPNSCFSCGREGSYLCYWCRESALIDIEHRCYKCNKLSDFGAVCRSCTTKTQLKHIFIRTEYKDSAKELVHKMKFSYSGEAADIIASEILNTLPFLTKDTIVVHIPTITNHIRSRGFDHAKRIAKSVALKTNLEHYPALARLGQHRQVGSTRANRLDGVRGTFRVINNQVVRGKHILLIDDVLTTGATIEAAAAALKAAGAKSIDAAIFARAR